MFCGLIPSRWQSFSVFRGSVYDRIRAVKGNNMKKQIGMWALEAFLTLVAGLILWWSVVAFVCVVAIGVVGFIGFILFVDTIGEWLHRKRR